ncbi:MAG: hypothetical protein KAI79_11765, partial [Bacteroidales bacterium]|nr:hypothetical protein [Bacteroidales bacterium]
PIIALTANATKEEIEKYSQFFDDYLTKPVDEDLLLRTVAKFIEYTKNTKSEAEFENCISKLQKEKIEIGTFSDEAINELKRDIEPLYIKLLEVLSVDDLNIFIEKNKKFGKKYDINALIEYSEVLFEAVDYFNLNKINDLLRYYSEIIAIIYEK